MQQNLNFLIFSRPNDAGVNTKTYPDTLKTEGPDSASEKDAFENVWIVRTPMLSH